MLPPRLCAGTAAQHVVAGPAASVWVLYRRLGGRPGRLAWRPLDGAPRRAAATVGRGAVALVPVTGGVWVVQRSGRLTLVRGRP